MNSRAVDGIRIITAPDLWRIIKHSCIKASAAAAAALQKQIRITARQAFHKIVHAKNIIIGEISRIDICHAPVHIPLDIINLSLVQHCTDLLKHLIPHFFSGEIKKQLIS